MSVLSPYPADLDARLVAFFEDHGVESTNVRTMRRNYPDGTTSRELGHIDAAELIEDGVAAMSPESEALFIPCTAVRTLGAIDELERRLDRPVVTAIAATLWATLRVAGINGPRPGLGRLWAANGAAAALDRLVRDDA